MLTLCYPKNQNHSKVGKAGKGADVKIKESVGGIAIYSGTPGPACGHSVQVCTCIYINIHTYCIYMNI